MNLEDLKYSDPYRYDEIMEEALTNERDIMDKEQQDLLDSMVDGFMQDIMYQFSLDHDSQALTLVRESLDRLETENDKTLN